MVDEAKDDARRMTVALAVRTMSPPAWVKAVADRLSGMPSVDLSLYVVAARPPSRSGGTERPAGRFWRAFVGLDRLLRRWVYRAAPDPRAVADLGHLGLRDASALPGDLDLIVDLSGGAVRDVLPAAGRPPIVWFDHDGHESWTTASSGYSEVVHGAGVTRCRLLCLPPGASRPSVLRTGLLATHPLFVAENRMQLLWKSIPLLIQEVGEFGNLAAFPCEEAELSERSNATDFYSEQRPIGVVSVVGHVVRCVRFVARRVLRAEQWFLLTSSRPRGAGDGIAASAFPQDLGGLHPMDVLAPGRDRYWADPHVVPGSQGLLVLVEEYIYKNRRGRIAMLRLTETGQVAEVRTVLELECHLSYPSVFEFSKALYMVPESRELGRVDAYKCTSYPWGWEYAATLLHDVRACDSSIVQYQARWWLFTTISEHEWLTPRDSLHLFFAEDPLHGPWRPHPQNPIACSAYNSRPAGQPFVSGGRLYRPSQDCSKGYGYGVRLMEVTTMTEERFEEREVAFLEPTWPESAVATHTLALDEHRVVVDVMRWLPRLNPAFLGKIGDWLGSRSRE